MDVTWNLWHGCTKKSEGCLNCYVYRQDSKYDIDSSLVKKNKTFTLPIDKNKKGEYKVKSGDTVYTCFTSDFFLEDADEWRKDAWDIIRERRDLKFLFITKRIERFNINLPSDWGDGWDNVTICCTCENQKRADERLPIYKSLPIKHKIIICEPLLEAVNLEEYLDSTIEQVVAGGESGEEARPCNFDWVLDIRRQCLEKGVAFYFKQTGAKFIKDNKMYRVLRKYQHSQAQKANINYKLNELKNYE